ncbi:MAG TPA: DUF1553 domain-containing protein [Candidatus Acidoferrum sp.]|nr:DUF1553 domain-containing protein [Candidatus Acidoferrum sp.]
MKASVISTLILLAALRGPIAARAQTGPYESAARPAPAGEVDRLVFTRLKELDIQPANLCSDAVFVRRAYLDVIGTQPSAAEASSFILNRDPDKRAKLIDQLLARDEFADYWAMKWSDLLRVKAEFPINLWPNAAQTYHRWIRAAIAENRPYDQFVRDLLTASGSNFEVGQANFYRAMQNRDPKGIAQTVALTFMGTRADQWPSNQLAGLAAFFSQVGIKTTAEWKQEIVYWNPASTNTQTTATFPDGTSVRLSPDRDPREVFADWLIDAKNPWFARNLVNRVWSWLLGRGIIQEPDDIRPDNPPSNPELLACLEQEFVASHYDVKRVFRLILNSQTYQLSCLPRSNSPEAAANFAFYPLRQLDAEVLADALCEITGTTEKYSSSIPEPFTFIPETERSIALPDGSISSAFLEMFGRPPRDTGLESERNHRPTANQRLHLLNSSHIRTKIEQSEKFKYLLKTRSNPRDVVTGFYLAVLSRFPTEEELRIAVGHISAAGANNRAAALDVAWALLNSAEFLYRH